MAKKQWVLCECGFNQRLFEGARESGTSVREIARFSSLPHVVVSSSWDSGHLYVEIKGEYGRTEGSEGQGEVISGDKGGGTDEKSTMSIFTGRWKALDELQGLLNGEKVMEVMEIGNRILVKTDNGRLLSVNKHVGQLTTPQHLASVEKLYSVQSGGTVYAKLTDGLMYACTLSSNTSLDLTTPILPGVRVEQVACGSDHILLLSSKRVWSGGLNHRGQLGHGDIHPRPHPSLIEALDGICFEAISCGNWHNLALSEYGDIYSWGWNVDQQLGHSADTATVATPTLVDVEEGEVNFKSVQCGSRHSAALTVCGILYTWGWNTYGQLGHRNPLSRVGPAPITRDVVSWVHCSPWSTLFLNIIY